MAWGSSLLNRFRRDTEQPILTETAQSGPPTVPTRLGFEPGIPGGGLTEYSQGIGGSTQTDRRSMQQQLFEAYLTCPWAWASVNAIARTITAGGLVSDWDADDGEGDQNIPPKPTEVLAMERLLAYVSPEKDIRQLTRNIIVDLLVFGDAFVEVTWIGNQPVALYNLDSPTMCPIVSEHGVVSKYVQITDFGQRAEFEPREVIHIALDAPRSGVFGISPTQAAMLPIVAWLFAAANGKELFRKGQPPTIHVDFPAGMQQAEINRWLQQYAARNVGPRNLGTPIATKGGATIAELAQGSTADLEAFLSQKRDEILAVYGVPPSKASVIESGNLGGGTGEAQDKTFRVTTCQPIAQIVLEKLNFHLVRQGFGITDWHLKFEEIDMRDSKTIEDIHDQRIRNGLWTLNRGRIEIGEPPVEGGDDPVLVDRQNLVQWRDMEAMSKAGVAFKLKGTALEPTTPVAGKAVSIEKAAPPPLVPVAAPPPGVPDLQPGTDAETTAAKEPQPTENLRVLYRARLREALATLPGGVDEYAA